MNGYDLLADSGVDRPWPGAAPTAFRIWQPGVNQTDKGPVDVTPEAIASVLASQELRGNLYSIDCDHGSLSSTAPPELRVAVGWHRLEARPALEGEGLELWACDVEWSPFARAQLEQKPPGFRYFSPAYDVNVETRELVRYLNLALTINPATWNVTALATATTGEIMSEETTVAASETAAEKKDGGGLSMSDVMAALHKMASDGDEKTRAQCEKMMRAGMPSKMAADKGDDSDDAGDDDEDEGPASKKEPPPKKDTASKKDSVTASIEVGESADPIVKALATRVQELSTEQAKIKAEKIAEERASLAATPRLDPAIAKIIRDPSTPLATARQLASVQGKKPEADKRVTTETIAATAGAAQPATTRVTATLVGADLAEFNKAAGIRPDAPVDPYIDQDTGAFCIPTTTPSAFRARAAERAMSAQKGGAR